MLIGKADTVLVERARTAVTDAVTPILQRDGRSPPTSISQLIVTNLQELGAIREQNTDLREKPTPVCCEWQAVAQKLENENRQLRALLGAVQ